MPNRSILLIEYEASLRAILGACLSEFGGWNVILSSSIQDGINLCKTSRPDVILMDASAPEDDALILIEQLKQYSIRQAVPILLISSRADWFTQKELHGMGFSGAISKPFNPSTLSSQVVCLASLNEPKN